MAPSNSPLRSQTTLPPVTLVIGHTAIACAQSRNRHVCRKGPETIDDSRKAGLQSCRASDEMNVLDKAEISGRTDRNNQIENNLIDMNHTTAEHNRNQRIGMAHD